MRRVKEAASNIIGNYIFGLPEDTRDTMQRTLDLALELNCEFANFYSAMAYPGSPLYEQALGLGWALPEKWSGYSQHAIDTLPLPTRHLPAGEVLRFRDRAFDVYFSHLPYLAMIRAKFGKPPSSTIRQMTAHRSNACTPPPIAMQRGSRIYVAGADDDRPRHRRRLEAAGLKPLRLTRTGLQDHAAVERS